MHNNPPGANQPLICFLNHPVFNLFTNKYSNPSFLAADKIELHNPVPISTINDNIKGNLLWKAVEYILLFTREVVAETDELVLRFDWVVLDCCVTEEGGSLRLLFVEGREVEVDVEEIFCDC